VPSSSQAGFTLRRNFTSWSSTTSAASCWTQDAVRRDVVVPEAAVAPGSFRFGHSTLQQACDSGRASHWHRATRELLNAAHDAGLIFSRGAHLFIVQSSGGETARVRRLPERMVTTNTKRNSVEMAGFLPFFGIMMDRLELMSILLTVAEAGSLLTLSNRLVGSVEEGVDAAIRVGDRRTAR
jgi:hypothetical protein